MRGFEEKRKNIKKRVYTEKKMNEYLNSKIKKSETKCGMTVPQIVNRWKLSKEEARDVARRFGIRVFNRLIVPYDVTQTQQFRGTIAALVQKHRRKDE